MLSVIQVFQVLGDPFGDLLRADCQRLPRNERILGPQIRRDPLRGEHEDAGSLWRSHLQHVLPRQTVQVRAVQASSGVVLISVEFSELGLLASRTLQILVFNSLKMSLEFSHSGEQIRFMRAYRLEASTGRLNTKRAFFER